MGSGRVRWSGAIAGLIGAIAMALLVAGCGESRHANEQRPSPSTRVSVRVSPKEVVVQPLSVATGPEKTQQIPQNQNDPQPPIRRSKVPLNIVFVITNQTENDLHLKIEGTKAESGPVYANGPGSFQTSLPTGSYVISAAGVPGAKPAHLTVGSFRASSQNDVLLP
jgi:hypothetical protein